MKVIRALKRETREGFRLLVAWLIGFASFGFVSYLRPAGAEGLLFFVIGLGFVAIAGAVLFEGLKRRHPHT
jgi:hypothetical protein